MEHASAYLCIGGPLDGQYRCMPNDVVRFKAVMGAVEYQLIWSSEHSRLVWWGDEKKERGE